MGLRGKRDYAATAERNFKSAHSYVRLGDGGLVLKKQDWLDQCAKVYERDKQKCRGCGRHISGDDWADVHHIVKRSKGGSDNLENLVLLCRNCHNSRHPEHRVMWTPKEAA